MRTPREATPSSFGEAPEGYVDLPFVVEPNYAGWRLDRYLAEKLRRLSRERLHGIIQRGVLCEGRRLRPSTPVYPGLTFRIRRPASEEPETPTTLPVLFQDDWLLILDKPAGLPIHPTARYHKGTLVSLLRERFGEAFAEPAHRLDRETSGLVVCGRTTESCRVLGRLFVSRDVHKEYLALCEGHPPEDSFHVDAPIAEGTELIRIAVRIDPVAGKESRTRFQVLQRFSRDGQPFALLRCFPETGRQHQIRIHLREAGFPLVGDKMYGPDPGYFDRFSKRCLEPEAWVRLRLPRHALHAAHISFPHPGTAERVSFDSPLPEDLQDFIAGRPVALAPPPRHGSPMSHVTQKLQTLRSLMTGHTDRREERRILDLLGEATAVELNHLLLNVELDTLLSDVDDRVVGPDHRTELLELLCMKRARELGLPVRAALVTALQRGHTPALFERMLHALFLGLSGRELTDFKNLLDGRGNSHDLQQLLFHDLDDALLRQDILTHLQREAELTPSGENKVLSDIDDTFLANWKDTRYPPKTVYPGVLQFYRELDRGPGPVPGREGDLTFISARPQDPLGFIEDRTLATLREHGVSSAVMLSGAFSHLLGNARIAAMKLENFSRYVQLYPEYGFVFTGDSGQGDVVFGEQMLCSWPEQVRAVFIHDVVDTPEPVRQSWRDKGVFFFDSYVGAAVEAFEVGVISRDGVARVVGAAREELARVAFASEAQRTARVLELERDIQRTLVLGPLSA